MNQLFLRGLYIHKKKEATVRVSFGRGEKVDCFIAIRLAYKAW